ncbi:hypothetical protein CPB84DRAFT_1368936 [Gymnopilus junonius]|uniref:Uncharacterized protein n=1 Tax=Gymnopilus junonius TaxID=109634 RepID=A0A9P5NJE4_GYMJU|nr:hypothetical protein CPB84DRAFT_1368936 [Gymnopilus junonius]
MAVLQISDDDLQYLFGIAQMSTFGDPTEYDAYGVITEAFILHKQPRERYIIFPQLHLRWNPDITSDGRGSLPDFCLGKYYDSAPHIRLQGGVEVKRLYRSCLGFDSTSKPFARRKSEESSIRLHIPGRGPSQSSSQGWSASKWPCSLLADIVGPTSLPSSLAHSQRPSFRRAATSPIQVVTTPNLQNTSQKAC